MEYYLILDLAFVITSWFTLLQPAFKIAQIDWDFKQKFWHFVFYNIVAFILFPFWFIAVVFFNKAAIEGYARGISE